jgi:membrane associated rhomboid family serine protease
MRTSQGDTQKIQGAEYEVSPGIHRSHIPAGSAPVLYLGSKGCQFILRTAEKTAENTMKYLFVLIFIIVYILSGIETGYTASSPVYTHFTYMFAHAGLAHLFVNSLAFTGMFHALEKLHICKGWILALPVMACGFIASFGAQSDVPTVGSSSMVYAMAGAYLVWIWRCKTVKITDRTKFITFIICICVSLIISYFRGSSNFPLHLLSILCGGVWAGGLAIFKNCVFHSD